MSYPLALAGWDAMSIWGWDQQAGSWFAQLTRNDSDDADGPDVWLSGVSLPIADEPALAVRIAESTACSLADVVTAMDNGRRYVS